MSRETRIARIVRRFLFKLITNPKCSCLIQPALISAVELDTRALRYDSPFRRQSGCHPENLRLIERPFPDDSNLLVSGVRKDWACLI